MDIMERKIRYVVKSLEENIKLLDGILKRSTERDKTLFQKTVYIKVALEELINRLKTIVEPTIKPESLMFTLEIIYRTLKNLSTDAHQVSPNIEHALYTTHLTVGSIEIDVSDLIESTIDEEVHKILSEAEKIAERRAKETFPNIQQY